jgi:hypothetical protein
VPHPSAERTRAGALTAIGQSAVADLGSVVAHEHRDGLPVALLTQAEAERGIRRFLGQGKDAYDNITIWGDD